MLFCGSGHFGWHTGLFGVVAAHQPLQFGELVDHLGRKVGLGPAGGLLGQIWVGAHGGGDLAGQCCDTVDPFGLRPQLVMERHLAQRVQPLLAAGLGHAQVVLPEELGIGQPCGQHLLVARQNGRAVIGGFAVGDGDEPLDAARLGVLHRKEFLMLAHTGLQHLWRQVQILGPDLAHQHHGPFDQPCDLGQQAAILDHFQPGGKRLVGGVLPDRLGPFGSVKDDMPRLQRALILIEGGDSERAGRHETVPFGAVAGLDPVHVHFHDAGLARVVGQDTENRVQRPHPTQAARAPAHGFGPGEIADDACQHLGHDDIGGAALLGDLGEIDLALFLVADLQRVAADTGTAQKALDRLFRRIGARALAFLGGGGGCGEQALHGQRQAARRGKRGGACVGQPGLYQPVGHARAQVVRRARLHARGNFFGKKFDQQIRHGASGPVF